MAADVPTELAVYPGMYHSGEVFVLNAPISQKMSGNYLRAIKEALNKK